MGTTGVASPFTVLVRGDIFFVGGGGRGMLGGGGIMRLVGLLTFFILALALGGGMGVLVGVSSLTAPPSWRTLGAGSGVALAVAASSRAGGTGGGGRRRGVARLCTAVVRRLGTATSLLGFDAAGLAASG